MNEMQWLRVIETLKYVVGEIEAAAELTIGTDFWIEEDSMMVADAISDATYQIIEGGRLLEDIVMEMEHIIKGHPSRLEVSPMDEEEFYECIEENKEEEEEEEEFIDWIDDEDEEDEEEEEEDWE